MNNTFHTWAVADAVDAGCRIEVASDASLDEGAVIRTIAEPSILSSGVEYFLGLQDDEAAMIAEALEVLADTDVDARTSDEREAVSGLLARVERLRGYLRGPVDHSEAAIPLSRGEALAAVSRDGASAEESPARTMHIHGWTIRHDGVTWWAERDGEEPYAATSYLEAARWAGANPAAVATGYYNPTTGEIEEA